MKKVLFIQHATAFGGSAMSLLYTLQGIQKMESGNYKLIVALAKWTNSLAEFYNSYGFEVVNADWIDTYEHTELVSYNFFSPLGIYRELRQRIKLKKARRNTRELVEKINPDIVHLNSVVLFGSALELNSIGLPFVWHVREPSVNGLFGIRKQKIIKALKTLPNRTIFICNADKHSWGDPDNGIVVYNFIDFEKFSSALTAKPEWGIDCSGKTFNILFLGGMNKVKGTIVMIRAFGKFKEMNPGVKVKLIFAGGKYNRPDYFIYKLATVILPFLGMGTYSQKVEKEIQYLNLERNLIRLPFEKEVARILAISNVLVFPSIRPHFARPIIEASAMSLPVLGSNLGGVSELIDDGVNGYYCSVNNPNDIAVKLNILFHNPQLRKKFGEKGFEKALSSYNQEANIKQILKIYNEILPRKCI